MRSRRLLLRLLAALVAMVQGFAPGAASILDARPAALALSERPVTHFEAPGSDHAIAHREHCVLCHVATHGTAEPVASPPVADAMGRGWPARDAWIANSSAAEAGDQHSRAPPV